MFAVATGREKSSNLSAHMDGPLCKFFDLRQTTYLSLISGLKNTRCYVIHMSVFSLKWIKLGFTYGLLHKVTICPAFYRSISLIFQILQNRAELFAKELRYFKKKLRLLLAPKNFTTSSFWKTATKKYLQQHTNSCFRVEIVVSTTFSTLIQILCRRIDKSEHLHLKPTEKW